MFKNIGIFVKEKAHHGIDATALNELVISLRKSSTSIFIEKGSGYKNEHLVELNYEEFVLKTDLPVFDFEPKIHSKFENVVGS